MRTTLTLCLIVLCFNTYAQRVVKVFGLISPEEIELKSYDKNPEAKALILYDRGESEFYDTGDDLDIRFTRHTRIKIFDKSASEYAEISIPLYRSNKGIREKLASVQAVTYNVVNGVLQEKHIAPSDIYEEQVTPNWVNTKFVFPDVQDGSILDLKYVIESPFKFTLPEWRFQDKIPTLYSEYEVRMIPFYEYEFLAQGITEFDYQNQYVSTEKRKFVIDFTDNVYTFALKDVPAFEDESFISSINDYIIKIDFQLSRTHSTSGVATDRISTWVSLNKSLLKSSNFGKYQKNCTRFVEKILESELDISGLSGTELCQTLINYVKNTYKWNERDSKYTSQSAKHFVETKAGNSAEINLFLIALLNSAGIQAEPVVLSTRDHGKIPSEYPFKHFTNYVVARVTMDSSSFYTDATDRLLCYNRLPSRCFNGKGILVTKSKEAIWLDMNMDWSSTESSILTLTLDTVTKNIDASVSIESTEYNSWKNRKRFLGDTSDMKAYYTSRIGEISRAVSSDYRDPSKPYTITVDGQFETDKIAHNIVIKPFLNLQPTKSSFTQKERNYPIDFIYPWKKEFESTLTVPSGYTVSSQPKPFNIKNELVEIKLHSELEGNLLTVKGIYYFKKALYPASDYHKIKRYFDQIIDHFNQPVILKKID